MSKPLASFVASAIALILGVSAAYAALTTESCLAKKRAAQGNLQKCRATEDAKALQNKPANLGKCATKFQEKIAALNEKASDAEIECRYADNSDGTITDHDTGLQWEKKDDTGGGPNLANPHDVDNTYNWNTAGGGTTPNGIGVHGFPRPLEQLRSAQRPWFHFCGIRGSL